MKKSILFAITTLIILNTKLTAQDTAFFDFGWTKMMEDGSDYQSIMEWSSNAYSDTAFQKKEYNYHHFERWNSFWKNRVYSSPEDIGVGNNGMFYYHSDAVAAAFGQGVCTSHVASNWESWGFNTHPKFLNNFVSEYGGMGIMSTVTADTSDPSLQILYAGTPLGGIWKTTDQGDNWVNISDVLNSVGMSITDIKIDPHDNQHLLVSTGTKRYMDRPGVGVIESIDAGATWAQTGLKNIPTGVNNPNAYVQKVYFHPTDTNKYYAIVKDKLLYTTNQGVSWSTILFSAPSPLMLEDLRFHPTNPDTMYLSTANEGAKLYRSYNGGANFTDITSNFNLTNDTLNLISIDVSLSNPDGLYVCYIASKINRVKFRKSNDFGSTFSPPTTFTNNGLYHGISKNIFLVSPTNDDDIIVGGIKVYQSSTGFSGISGVSMDFYKIHDDMRGGEYVDGLIMLATDGGITVSTNDGSSWSNRYDGLNVQQCFGHDVDEDFTYLLTGLQDVGAYRYDIASQTWNNMNAGMDGGLPSIFASDPTRALAGHFCGYTSCNFEVHKYWNNGLDIAGATTMPKQWHAYAKRVFIDQPNDTVFTGMEDVYTTNKSGTYYNKITDFDGTGVKGDIINDYIVAIANTPADTNLLAIGFGNPSWGRDENNIPCGSPGSTVCPQKKFFISRDNGSNWINRTTGQNSVQLPIRGCAISDVIISPNDAGKIWVSFSGYGDGKKVFFSPDTGLNWYNHSYDLPNVPVHSIVHQANANDRLFIATDAGVFINDADMTTWDCYNNNLPAAYYEDLDLNSCGKSLTVSSQGRGVWRSPIPDVELSGNKVWSGIHKMASSIIIYDTLTVTGTIKMPSNTKITVMPGAKLILDGGILTHSDCGNDLWQGVELLGDPTKSQSGDPMGGAYNQGYIKLTNGARIEEANVGILAGSTDTNLNKAGGLIHMEDSSVIINCRMGVLVKPYVNYNQSTYTNSFFHNDGLITDPATGELILTEAFVSLQGTTIVGHEFDSMEFKYEGLNFRYEHFDSINLQGIQVVGKRYGTTSNPFVQNSRFENLSYGIRAGNLSTGVGNDIKNNEFINLRRGIYVLGGYSLEIKDNYFDVADINGSDNYAMMLAGISAFDIRRNTIAGGDDFNYSGGSSWHFYGIIIENSSSGGGIVFDNQIGVSGSKEMDRCLQAQGDNNSLTIRCNNFYRGPYSGATGLLVWDMPGTAGQLRDQGHPNCLLGSGQPNRDKAAAGNEWQRTCSDKLKDIRLDTGIFFEYYAHTRDEASFPTTDPDCSPTSWYSSVSPPYFYDCQIDKIATSCDALYTPPSGGGGGGPGPGMRLKSGADELFISNYYLWYRSLLVKQQNFVAQVKGNQTEAQWIQTIESNSNATSLAQDLSNAAPLSDGVLNSLIEAWAGEENALLKNILMENVPLSKEQLVIMHKKGLEGTWANDIYSATAQHSLRDSLVQMAREVRFAAKELQMAEWKLYRQLVEESKTKEATTLLDTSFFSASLQLLAKDYAAREEFSKCNQLLNRLKNYAADGHLEENKTFATNYEHLLGIYQSGKSAQPGEANLQLLSKLALQKDAVGAEAEAILQLESKKFVHHPIMKIKSSEGARFSSSSPSNDIMQQFVLYPNPNSGSATIAYELAGKTTALWQLFDVNGRLVMQLNLPVGVQQKQLNVSGLSNGVYHFSVTVKQERIQSGKMVITRR